jgi:hypothetical protein
VKENSAKYHHGVQAETAEIVSIIFILITYIQINRTYKVRFII